jgi:hypothetical protein
MAAFSLTGPPGAANPVPRKPPAPHREIYAIAGEAGILPAAAGGKGPRQRLLYGNRVSAMLIDKPCGNGAAT